MTINIGRLVSKALATAKSFGLTAEVTITRATGSPSSFVVTATSEGPEADEPHTGGLEPQSATIWTMAANDCAFKPETGHTLTVNGQINRVISNNVTNPAAADVLYQVEVAL